jgi:hypothetical protein
MIYYYEKSNGSGQFKADCDQDALKKMPKNTICLYHESLNSDGTPFIIIYEK